MAVNNPQPTVSPYVEGVSKEGLVRVTFRIQTNTTSAPDKVIPAGAVTAADQTGTGLYSITLANYTKYSGFVGGSVGYYGTTTTTDGIYPHIVSYTASTGVLLVDLYSLAATPALADATDDMWLMCDLVFALNAAEVVSTTI